MKTFEFTDGGRDAAGLSNERLDCTVRALAISAGWDYARAHAWMRIRGRRKTGHKASMWLALDGQPWARYIRPRRQRVSTFLREHPKGIFIARIRGHVFAVIDGCQRDLGMPCTNCIVKDYWVIDRERAGASL